MPQEDWGQCWWLILSDGTPIPGNRGGGVLLLGEVQMTRNISRLLIAIRLSSFIDGLDRRFAVWRSWMSAFVPDGPAPHRFP